MDEDVRKFVTAPTATPASGGRASGGRFAAGTELGGDFVIERPLAEGGMGAVYVALQRSTGVRRALKVMHETLIADESLAKRFRREAELAATVESDHVVKILTAGYDGAHGVAYLVMELLAGASLARTIEQLAPLSPGLTASILVQLAHGLGAAGDVGIVHRDVKPENLFLCRSSSATAPFFAKLLDFGVAKDVNHASRAGTQAVGTPFWLAPEQTESEPRLSPATDVWPFGLVAYSCLVGRPFWRSAGAPGLATPASFLRELLLEPIPAASERAAAQGRPLPEGFDAWFARCVARSADDRFPSARAAAEAFVATIAKPEVDAPELARLVKFLKEEAAQASPSYIGFEPTVATPSPHGRPAEDPRLGTAGGTAPSFPMTSPAQTVPRPELTPETGPLPLHSGPPKGLFVGLALIALGAVAVALWPRRPPPVATPTQDTRGPRPGEYLCRLEPSGEFGAKCALERTGPDKLQLIVHGATTTCFVTVRLGEGNKAPIASGSCNQERGMDVGSKTVQGAVRLLEAQTYEVERASKDDAYLAFRGPFAK